MPLFANAIAADIRIEAGSCKKQEHGFFFNTACDILETEYRRKGLIICVSVQCLSISFVRGRVGRNHRLLPDSVMKKDVRNRVIDW
ncbi:MAG: hypothetical protein A3G60_03150 [Candidatus Ryanbacteria bacterium RIFCSPLOWO2_12_FULL_47_9c]|uniref:Uncharacterized protein n=1 Tax=Candidatus Ryanbacteria bacterium RIFCSPLOWO2_12_FULL_47_9c TaxID=1802131 RepID=A0A1G2H7D2_9BACT|nr:MAG: hypothetical protein A3G60_03150 [Candidatus Ryanbacteria bacterium RIFCSPLOWO2_12_FULL_47_9c]